MWSSTATVRVPTASSSARSWETSSSEPGKRLQRVLERLAALEVEVVGRLVEDQDVGVASATRIASDSRRRSPPQSPSSGLSTSSPLNRKRPSSARAWLGVSPVRLTAASSTVRAPPRLELLGVLGEVADLDVVAGAQLAARRAARSADQRVDQRRLARAVGPDERDVLAALEPQLGVVRAARRRSADLERAVLELEDHAARALGLA